MKTRFRSVYYIFIVIIIILIIAIAYRVASPSTDLNRLPTEVNFGVSWLGDSIVTRIDIRNNEDRDISYTIKITYYWTEDVIVKRSRTYHVPKGKGMSFAQAAGTMDVESVRVNIKFFKEGEAEPFEEVTRYVRKGELA